MSAADALSRTSNTPLDLPEPSIDDMPLPSQRHPKPDNITTPEVSNITWSCLKDTLPAQEPAGPVAITAGSHLKSPDSKAVCASKDNQATQSCSSGRISAHEHKLSAHQEISAREFTHLNISKERATAVNEYYYAKYAAGMGPVSDDIMSKVKEELEQKDFDLIALMMSHDMNGDGVFHPHELYDIFRTAMEANKHKEDAVKLRKKVKWLLLGIILLAALVFGMTIAAVFTMKDSFVGAQDGVMRSIDGKVVRVASSESTICKDGTMVAGINQCTVAGNTSEDGTPPTERSVIKTGIVESFATLFDLPDFDLKTLGEVRLITLALDDGEEAVYKVHGVVKKRACLHTVKFLVEGGYLVVDGSSQIAFVTSTRERHVVQHEERRLRRLAHHEHEAIEEEMDQSRLYTAEEFFVPEFGFEADMGMTSHRRMQAASERGGWASLMLAASGALLDACKDDENGPVSNAMLIGMAYFLTGPKAGTEHPLQVYYNASNPMGSKVRLGDTIEDFSTGMLYKYQDVGLNKLYGCEDGLQVSGDNFTSMSEQRSASGLRIYGDKALEQYVVYTEQFKTNVHPESAVKTPTIDECSAAKTKFPEGIKMERDTSEDVEEDEGEYVDDGNATSNISSFFGGENPMVDNETNYFDVDDTQSSRRLYSRAYVGSKGSPPTLVELWNAARNDINDCNCPNNANLCRARMRTCTGRHGWKTMMECNYGSQKAKFMTKRGWVILTFECLGNPRDVPNTVLPGWTTTKYRGYHLSSGPNERLSHVLQCVEGFRNSQRVDAVVGYSLGGAIAEVYTARQWPDVAIRGVFTFGSVRGGANSARTNDCGARIRGQRLLHPNDGAARFPAAPFHHFMLSSASKVQRQLYCAQRRPCRKTCVRRCTGWGRRRRCRRRCWRTCPPGCLRHAYRPQKTNKPCSWWTDNVFPIAGLLANHFDYHLYTPAHRAW